MEIITFLSDFGDKDWFVAAVKGQILKIAPDVRIVDITHNIKPHDIRSAAFVLKSVYGDFPDGTVHLAVVDPGVGSARLPIIVQARDHFFVGPDNGIFSYVLDRKSKVFSIDIKTRVSKTFHARDVFGPVAARLSLRKNPLIIGKPISKCIEFTLPLPRKKGNIIKGEIIYIDQFGNLITNIAHIYDIEKFVIADKEIFVMDDYSEVDKGGLVAVKGSSGYYEIACYQGDAREILNAKIRTLITAKTAP